MKSLYGTIINHSPRSLFDIQHIYPNAQMMHNSVHEDNVPLYGYVLVYYGEPTEALYTSNLNTDQIYGAEEISIDYNKTVWQKRPDYQNNGAPHYFSIARLNSVLPYTQEAALKGYKNQVVFQRLNAFPLQGEIGYYYQDFGTDAANYEVIHFDNKAMKTFNENEFTDEVRNKFNEQWPAITPKITYTSLYAANQDIDNSEIVDGDYILISYSDAEDEEIYTQEYENNKLLDWTNYGNKDEQLNIDYHHMIFQKQDNKYILSSQNRIELKQISDEGVVLWGKTEPEFAYSYAMSTDNSRNLQERIETEIFRTETKMETARANIAVTQSTIKAATVDMLKNSNDILDNRNKLNEEQGKIQANVELIKNYQTDTDERLSIINSCVEEISTQIQNINTELNVLNDNNDLTTEDVYSTLNNIATNIKTNNDDISTEIDKILLELAKISNETEEDSETEKIDISANQVRTFINNVINDANNNLENCKLALKNANDNISSATQKANTVINDLIAEVTKLDNASDEITDANTAINENVTSLDTLTTIDDIKTYTNNITTETENIVNTLGDLASISINLTAIEEDSLTSIKNLKIINEPAFQDLGSTNEPENILGYNNLIKRYVTNIKNSINNEKIKFYIDNIDDIINEDVQNLLQKLESIRSKIYNILMGAENENSISKLNENISLQGENLSTNLKNQLQKYYEAIEQSKKQSLIYSGKIEELENSNMGLTEKIQTYLQINTTQSELLNTVTDEYALYFGMWNWYGYVFLPSIKKITIEDTIKQGKVQKNDLPNGLKFYNTDTLEYPTK